MRKLGEQWVEEINGKRHMLKCVKQKAEISHIEEKIHPCHKCLFQTDDYDCAYPGDGWKCDMEKGTIIKDLGPVNKEGLLRVPFDVPEGYPLYPTITSYSTSIGEKDSLFQVVYSNMALHMAYGFFNSEQKAIDAWNRRA